LAPVPVAGNPISPPSAVSRGRSPPREYADAYFQLRDALGKLFNLPADLVTPANLGNPYFRQRVEQEKTLLYAA
jgi:hypothetical protein